MLDKLADRENTIAMLQQTLLSKTQLLLELDEESQQIRQEKQNIHTEYCIWVLMGLVIHSVERATVESSRQKAKNGAFRVLYRLERVSNSNCLGEDSVTKTLPFVFE